MSRVLLVLAAIAAALTFAAPAHPNLIGMRAMASLIVAATRR